jgi:hypothetical protein
MVVADHGQADGARWQSIRAFKAFRPNAGIPVLRFIHPRWTGMWSALKRADADLYYTSCAGMQVGLIALFCWRHRRRFVFRAASDTDCDRSRLLLQYARDRWLYEQGLRRADAILVQSVSQQRNLAQSYGLQSRVAGMLVEAPLPTVERDIEVLWVSISRDRTAFWNWPKTSPTCNFTWSEDPCPASSRFTRRSSSQRQPDPT